MVVSLSALRAGRRLPPRKIRGIHFYQRLCRPQDRGVCHNLIKITGRKIVLKWLACINLENVIIKLGALINKQGVPDTIQEINDPVAIRVLHIRCTESHIWVIIKNQTESASHASMLGSYMDGQNICC
jgi:hypothetical protein